MVIARAGTALAVPYRPDAIAERPISSLGPDDITALSIEDKRWLASQTECSPELLNSLAHEDDPRLRLQIASNPSTPTDLLALLLSDDIDMKERIAANPSCPREALRRLLEDDDVSVRTFAATNPRSPIARRIEIAREVVLCSDYITEERDSARRLSFSDPFVPLEPLLRAHAGRHEVAAILGNAEDPLLRYLAASCPDCPTELLQRLAQDEERVFGDEFNGVWHGILANPTTSEETLLEASQILHDGASQHTTEARERALHIAYNPAITPRLLLEIAAYPDRTVASELAQSSALSAITNLTESVLLRASPRAKRLVAEAVESRDAWVLEILAIDEDQDVRRAVCANPSSSEAARTAAFLMGV